MQLVRTLRDSGKLQSKEQLKELRIFRREDLGEIITTIRKLGTSLVV